MSQMDLDRLARRLADGGVTRRGALKAVALAALTAGLRALGVRAPNVYADDGPPEAPAATLNIYLPTLQRACTEASRCGSRKYCDEKQGCLCVQTAEGDIRCGLLPSCDAKLCTKSADCADVAPGAFCDTPLSGCCTSPPNTLSRCLLPCPTCPSGPRCGGACCGNQQICRNNQCVADCAVDLPTSESLTAAWAALAGGATKVSLSPGGCVAYERTLSQGTLTREYLYRDSRLWSSIIHTATTTNIDYYNETGTARVQVVQIRRDAVPNNQWMVYQFYDANQVLEERITYTRENDVLHVKRERRDANGQMVVWVTFDVPVPGAPTAPALSPLGLQALEGISYENCSTDDRNLINPEILPTLMKGLLCLNSKGLYDALGPLQYYMGGGLKIVCDSTMNLIGQADWWMPGGFPGPTTGMTIKINPTKFGNAAKQQLLFHEMLHFAFGEHNGHLQKSLPSEDFIRRDRGESCANLCFNPLADKCHCATCLGRDVCDSACAGLRDCTSPDDSTCCNQTGVTRCKGTNAAARTICCPNPGVCAQDPAGDPICKKPQIVCPACPQKNRALQCFDYDKASDCEQACSNGGLACPFSCRPAASGECP